MSVIVPDFTRCFLRWTIDTVFKPPTTVSRPLPMTLNHVRMPVEASVVLTNKRSGVKVRYFLGVECRTEQVWVERDIWHLPNASMCMIGGDEECLIETHWASVGSRAVLDQPGAGAQPERMVVSPVEAFSAFALDVLEASALELLDTASVIAAFAGAALVVATTEYTVGDFEVLLEYPVKTVNFSEREGYYQVDTGPILFVCGDLGVGSLVSCCWKAFIAHNQTNWAEVVVNVPTIIGGGARVHHYSSSVRVENVRNRMFRIM